MEDRRKTGVNHVMLESPGGETLKLVTATAKTTHVVIGAILSVVSLVLLVGGAAKWGVSLQVVDQIEAEATDDQSFLYRTMHDCAREEVEEIQAVIQDDLDYFDGQINEVKGLGHELQTGQAVQQSQISDMKDEIRANQTELLRVIREQGGGG